MNSDRTQIIQASRLHQHAEGDAEPKASAVNVKTVTQSMR